MEYRYFDHPRAAMHMLRGRAEDELAMARAARDLGLTQVCEADKRVREAMYATVGVAAYFAQLYANATGRSLTEVIDEAAVALELQIPPGHDPNEPEGKEG